MKAAVTLLLALLVAPGMAIAHPHIWISEVVRPIMKDGHYTHVEIEWRFDPYSSEIEIPLIDENKDGKFSAKEVKALANEMLSELKNYGYLTWLNTGGKDFRPPKPPVFSARIDNPATFTLPDWDRSAGDSGMPMPPNKQIKEPPKPNVVASRNLVYVMRFELPQPSKTLSLASFDPDDFIRIEFDKASIPAGCTLDKHPSLKAEYIRGYPVFSDHVTCRLP